MVDSMVATMVAGLLASMVVQAGATMAKVQVVGGNKEVDVVVVAKATGNLEPKNLVVAEAMVLASVVVDN